MHDKLHQTPIGPAVAKATADAASVALADLIFDAQTRAETREDYIAEYADRMREGVEFPPIVVFRDHEGFHVADGHYRAKAAERAGRTHVLAHVRDGGRREAILFGCGANANHGIRRSHADKRHGVRLLLTTGDEWWRWADSEIAKACVVSASFVGEIRSELESEGKIPEATHARKCVRRGHVYVQKLGRRRPIARPPIVPATPAKRESAPIPRLPFEEAASSEALYGRTLRAISNNISTMRQLAAKWIANGEDKECFEQAAESAMTAVIKLTGRLTLASHAAEDAGEEAHDA